MFVFLVTVLSHSLSQGGKGAVLGVSDSKLSASINDSCKVKCSHIGVMPEVIRGNTPTPRVLSILTAR